MTFQLSSDALTLAEEEVYFVARFLLEWLLNSRENN
jgi:hypothetical protein